MLLLIFSNDVENMLEKNDGKDKDSGGGTIVFLTLPMYSWSNFLLPPCPELLLALYNTFKLPENAQTLLLAVSPIQNTLSADSRAVTSFQDVLCVVLPPHRIRVDKP